MDNERNFDMKAFVFAAKLISGVLLLIMILHVGIDMGTNLFIKHKYGIAEENGKLIALAPAEDKGTVAKNDSPENLQTRFIAEKTIASSVPAKGKFIGVDLNDMKLYTYKDGERLAEYTVLGKGRPGSDFETPSGTYKVLYKNPQHFSSIGHVYMPYSMQFYGNFFIHGWPYYPDGTDVDPGFSGGCIRLSTADAKSIFDFADVNTPIFVYATNASSTDEAAPHLSLKNIPVPHVSADEYLIADLDTGEVFAEKDSSTPRPIASITKLMTAVVANETIAFNRKILVTESAVATEGNGEIIAGEHEYLNMLLYPLLLHSSNDAAVAIAQSLGQPTFVGLMNQKAKALDMADTHYEEPSGLSPNNVSTATDLFKLAKYIRNRKNFIFDITTQMARTITDDEGRVRTFASNNPMRGREDFLGGKNGYTPEAKKTLLSLFSIPMSGENHTIAIIVLGSNDHTGDTIALHDWIERVGATPATQLTLQR